MDPEPHIYPIDIHDIDLIIYHHGCPDGTAAAWPFWRENKCRSGNKLVLIGGIHGQTPPDVTAKIVVIVDFSYPRAVLTEMAHKARFILILDHHSSAQRDLEELNLPNLTYVFDLKRSGAQISWDYVYGARKRPWFIDVIAERDLWDWKKDYSKSAGKGMSMSGYYTWEKLEELYNIPAEDEASTIEKFDKIGQSYLEPETREIAEIAASAILTELTVPAGDKYIVKLVNCPSKLRSDVGNKLAMEGCDFAAMWTYDFLLDEWWVSLRGPASNKIDLSKISEQFAMTKTVVGPNGPVEKIIRRGGGHAKAAGFTIKGKEKLQTYFRTLEAPKSRAIDYESTKENK